MFNEKNDELLFCINSIKRIKNKAIKLKKKLDLINKKKKKDSKKEQFFWLLKFLREEGTWDDNAPVIDFTRPDALYIRVDKYLPIKELVKDESKYSLNFEKDARSEYVISFDNPSFVVIHDDEFSEYSMYDYCKNIFDDVDLSYFEGDDDMLKKIVGLCLVLEAQGGSISAQKKIMGIFDKPFRNYENAIINKRIKKLSRNGLNIEINQETSIIELDYVVPKILKNVVLGDNLKNIYKILKKDVDSHSNNLSGEIANKKLHTKIVNKFNTGFEKYVNERLFKMESIYNKYRQGKINFNKAKRDIFLIYANFLQVGLSPIETIAEFFNIRMHKMQGNYYKYLKGHFKGELMNWLEHSSNPLMLSAKKLVKIKRKEKSLSEEIELQKDGKRIIFGEKIGRNDYGMESEINIDLNILEKRLLKYAKTDGQKKRVKRNMQIVKMRLEGYSSSEIALKLGATKRRIEQILRENLNKLRKLSLN